MRRWRRRRLDGSGAWGPMRRTVGSATVGRRVLAFCSGTDGESYDGRPTCTVLEYMVAVVGPVVVDRRCSATHDAARTRWPADASPPAPHGRRGSGSFRRPRRVCCEGGLAVYTARSRARYITGSVTGSVARGSRDVSLPPCSIQPRRTTCAGTPSIPPTRNSPRGQVARVQYIQVDRKQEICRYPFRVVPPPKPPTSTYAARENGGRQKEEKVGEIKAQNEIGRCIHHSWMDSAPQ
jgi:hypothetical protein